ncbi:MAG TPA: hypothetical protein VMJ31_06265 [Methylocystis sp.]|nr:hypothetical protein [Methylocystis sp.]
MWRQRLILSLLLLLAPQSALAAGVISITPNPSPGIACQLNTIKIAGNGTCSGVQFNLGDETNVVNLPGILKQQADQLKTANQKAQAEIDRLVAVDNAGHGANWPERKKRAAELLSEAAKAPPERRSELEKSAGDLLAPANSP